MSLNSISQTYILPFGGDWLFVTGLSHPNGNVGESTPSGNCWHFGNLFSEKWLHLPQKTLFNPSGALTIFGLLHFASQGLMD